MNIRGRRCGVPDVSPPFAEAAVMLWAIQRRMVRGCGNHGCRIGKIEGMATNGPCRCTAKDFSRELRDIADMLERGGAA